MSRVTAVNSKSAEASALRWAANSALRCHPVTARYPSHVSATTDNTAPIDTQPIQPRSDQDDGVAVIAAARAPGSTAPRRREVGWASLTPVPGWSGEWTREATLKSAAAFR